MKMINWIRRRLAEWLLRDMQDEIESYRKADSECRKAETDAIEVQLHRIDQEVESGLKLIRQKHNSHKESVAALLVKEKKATTKWRATASRKSSETRQIVDALPVFELERIGGLSRLVEGFPGEINALNRKVKAALEAVDSLEGSNIKELMRVVDRFPGVISSVDSRLGALKTVTDVLAARLENIELCHKRLNLQVNQVHSQASRGAKDDERVSIVERWNE